MILCGMENDLLIICPFSSCESFLVNGNRQKRFEIRKICSYQHKSQCKNGKDQNPNSRNVTSLGLYTKHGLGLALGCNTGLRGRCEGCFLRNFLMMQLTLLSWVVGMSKNTVIYFISLSRTGHYKNRRWISLHSSTVLRER